MSEIAAHHGESYLNRIGTFRSSCIKLGKEAFYLNVPCQFLMAGSTEPWAIRRVVVLQVERV